MTDPFILDNWMLKFLTEQSAVLNSERWSAKGEESSIGHDIVGARISEPNTSEANGTLRTLSALISDKSLSNDALVENALSWLLD